MRGDFDGGGKTILRGGVYIDKKSISGKFQGERFQWPHGGVGQGRVRERKTQPKGSVLYSDIAALEVNQSPRCPGYKPNRSKRGGHCGIWGLKAENPVASGKRGNRRRTRSLKLFCSLSRQGKRLCPMRRRVEKANGKRKQVTPLKRKRKRGYPLDGLGNSIACRGRGIIAESSLRPSQQTRGVQGGEADGEDGTTNKGLAFQKILVQSLA